MVILNYFTSRRHSRRWRNTLTYVECGVLINLLWHFNNCQSLLIARRPSVAFLLLGRLWFMFSRWSAAPQILTLSVGPPTSGHGILSTVSPPVLPTRKIPRFHFLTCLVSGRAIYPSLGKHEIVFLRRRKRKPSQNMSLCSWVLTLDRFIPIRKMICRLTKLLWWILPQLPRPIATSP